MTTDKIKSVAKSAGNGILVGLTVVANASTLQRIDEIDAEMEELQEQMDQLKDERSELNARLITR